MTKTVGGVLRRAAGSTAIPASAGCREAADEEVEEMRW